MKNRGALISDLFLATIRCKIDKLSICDIILRDDDKVNRGLLFPLALLFLGGLLCTKLVNWMTF